MERSTRRRALGLAAASLVALSLTAQAEALAEPSPWRVPEVRSEPGIRTPVAALRANPAGDAVLAWAAGILGQQRIAVRRAGGPWSAPILVPEAFGTTPQPPAIDAAGNVLVAWSTPGNAVRAATWSAARGRFAPPVTLAEGQGSSTVHAALAPDGTAIVAWQARPDVGVVRVAVRPAGEAAFGAPETLSPRPAVLNGLAVDEDGTAVLSWLEREGAARHLPHVSVASVRPPGGPWGTPEELPGGAIVFLEGRPVATGGGTAVAGGSRTDGAVVVPIAAVRTESTWSGFEEIPGRDLSTRLWVTALGIDAKGDALALIRTGGTEHGAAVSDRPAGGTWSPLRRLPGPGRDDAELAVAPSGAAVVLWRRARAGDAALSASVRPEPGASWTAAEVVSAKGSRPIRATSLTIDAAGRATAAWSHDGRVFTADRAAGSPSTVRATLAQLRTNHRVAQAALRRANALIARLEGGIGGADIRNGALGAESFGGGVRIAGAETGALVGPGPAGELRVAAGRGAGDIRLSAEQLLVTQRIGQAAVRRANAIEAMLEGGLTGGNIADGTITAEHLAPGLSIAQARGGTPPAPARAIVAAPPRAGAGRVALTAGQLLINQRISQAAVRRLNSLAAVVERGLPGSAFAPGSITAADLAPELRR